MSPLLRHRDKQIAKEYLQMEESDGKIDKKAIRELSQRYNICEGAIKKAIRDNTRVVRFLEGRL